MAARFKLKFSGLTFKNMRFVFARGAFTVSRIGWRKRQKRSSLNLTDSDVGVSQEGVELLHKVFTHKVGQIDLV